MDPNSGTGIIDPYGSVNCDYCSIVVKIVEN